MGEIPGYILSVVCAAVLCGTIGMLFDKKNTVSGAVNMVLGLIMTVVVLKPIINTKPFELDAYWNSLQQEREHVLNEGSEYAKLSQEEFIKEKVESYIVEKTDSLGANVVVDVSLNEENLPVAANFSGSILPYLKLQVEDYVQRNFAIEKECITWN